MNHLPYKDWMLSEEPLTTEQSRALQEHLRTCDSCQQIEPAWTDVNALFRKAALPEPASGFTDRWQERLAAHKLQKQRRVAWLIVGAVGLIALLLFVLFSAQVLEIFHAPGNLLLVWISRLTGVLSLYWSLENLFSIITAQVPTVSLLLLPFGIGFISFLSVSWLAAYRKLTFARRYVA